MIPLFFAKILQALVTGRRIVEYLREKLAAGYQLALYFLGIGKYNRDRPRR
jgi:hypothetical protein